MAQMPCRVVATGYCASPRWQWWWWRKCSRFAKVASPSAEPFVVSRSSLEAFWKLSKMLQYSMSSITKFTKTVSFNWNLRRTWNQLKLKAICLGNLLFYAYKWVWPIVDSISRYSYSCRSWLPLVPSNKAVGVSAPGSSVWTENTRQSCRHIVT